MSTHRLLAAVLAGYAPDSALWRESVAAVAPSVGEAHLQAVLALASPEGVGAALAVPGMLREGRMAVGWHSRWH